MAEKLGCHTSYQSELHKREGAISPLFESASTFAQQTAWSTYSIFDEGIVENRARSSFSRTFTPRIRIRKRKKSQWPGPTHADSRVGGQEGEQEPVVADGGELYLQHERQRGEGQGRAEHEEEGLPLARLDCPFEPDKGMKQKASAPRMGKTNTSGMGVRASERCEGGGRGGGNRRRVISSTNGYCHVPPMKP